MKKILIIDDDLELCGLLADYLKAEGMQTYAVHDGKRGEETACAGDYDLAILDLMLPLKSGFEVLQEIRAKGVQLPVIMLTARGESADMISGLEVGADDYLPKPFNPRELLARMRTVMRRTTRTTLGRPDGQLTVDGFTLNEKSYQASYEGQSLNLTPIEFKIFWVMLNNPGKIITRETLFNTALGRRENIFDRSLDMHISRLRKKVFTRHDGVKRLKSIRGEGYLYVSPDGEAHEK